MDAACYAAASNMHWSADLAKQQPTGGIQVPFTHKTNFKLDYCPRNLNNHELTFTKEGCDGCSLLCCCWLRSSEC